MEGRAAVHTRRLLLLLIVALLLFQERQAQARIYTFVDEAGIIHFSNVPTDIRYKPASLSKYPKSGDQYFSQEGDDLVQDSEQAYKYDRFIRSAALRHEVDPLLVKAIIKAESDFNPSAVSRVGALGLMQLMPDTAREMRVSDPFDPAENINGGTRYIRKLLGMFKGNIRLALAAYNAGPTRIIEIGDIPNFTETTNYVKKVMFHYDLYRPSSSPRKRWVKITY